MPQKWKIPFHRLQWQYAYKYSASVTIADDFVTAIFLQESGGTLNNISNIIYSNNNNNGKFCYNHSANLSVE